MIVKYVKMNVDIPSTKIDLKRGMEWPLGEAPELVRTFAGLGPDKVEHIQFDQKICTIYDKEIVGSNDVGDVGEDDSNLDLDLGPDTADLNLDLDDI